MKHRITCLTVVFLMLLVPQFVAAQKMERPKDREPGDKATWNCVVNGKTQLLEETWTALTADEMVGVYKIGGKEYEVVLGRSPAYQFRKGICLTNGQVCKFSPGITFVDFPLEKGKKWTTTFTVTGEDFTSNVEAERKVERIEMLRAPAGEFETFMITTTGRITGKNSKGASFSGREDVTDWVALDSGKLIVVKSVYKNSFGEKYSFELISSSFK